MIQNELFLVLAAAFGAFLTKAVDWIFNKKSHKAEASGKELNNFDNIHEIYKDLMDDLTKRYEQKFNDITATYDKKIKMLEDEIGILNRRLKLMKTENSELRKRIKELEGK